MKIKPLKTAVIGCGMISGIYFENLVNRFSIVDVVGCSDLVPEKSAAAAEKFKIRQMTNEEILSDPSIELVVNLTYPASHYEISRAALSAGKHCYSEKMAALTFAEASELCELAKARNVYFATAPDTFLGASQQTARYIVDKGLIGEPISASAHLCRGYFMIKSDEDDAKRRYSVMRPGGGIPYDMGGYYLHQLFNIFGPAKSVSGYSYTRNADRPYLNPRHEKFGENFFVDTPNTLGAVMKFKNGVICNFDISSEHHVGDQRFEIYGTEGILHLGDPNLFGDKIYITGNNGEKYEFPLKHPFPSNSRGVGVADMAWAIRCGRKPRLSSEMGLHALELIEGVAESDRSGMRVGLTVEFERPAAVSIEYYPGACEEYSLYTD